MPYHQPDRPLSPHLQVYRLPLTAITSITHRITGIALSVFLMGVVLWLFALATSPESYAQVIGVAQSLIGRLILYGASIAFFFHLFNGIRHLMWDSGYAFEKKSYRLGNMLVLFSTVLSTAIFWIVLG
jgi:succinate dehydrogenase / fumarate reductase, cytochrome b subunit